MTRGHLGGNRAMGMWAEGSSPPREQLCVKDLFQTLGELSLEENDSLWVVD